MINNFIFDKQEFYNDLRYHYSTSLSILEKFKEDFKDIYFLLNTKKYSSVDLLIYINKRFPEYLETILIICNKSILSTISCMIKNTLDDNTHLIVDNYQNNLEIHINLSILVKQIYIKSKFVEVLLDNNSNVKSKKNIAIELTIDISNSEPIIVNKL